MHSDDRSYVTRLNIGQGREKGKDLTFAEPESKEKPSNKLSSARGIKEGWASDGSFATQEA
jgi:hypothetical protein